MPLRSHKTVVIGAGIGGLVSALELAHAGLPVTVVERAKCPGGKMRTIPTPAGPVDAGPTVFALRSVFEELFASVGESLDDRIGLVPLEVLARHHWRDSEPLDLYTDADRSRDAIGRFAGARAAAEFDAFCSRARLLFDAVDGPVMKSPNPTPLSVAAATLPQAPRLLPAIGLTASYWSSLSRAFTDPRLRQLFGRFATYVGGSPFRSPAILALIWHAEALGVSLVRGGMAALAQTLEAMCSARGVVFHYEAEAEDILVSDGAACGVTLRNGERLDARCIVFNGDPAALGAGLLGRAVQRAGRVRKRHARSLSAWVWTFDGVPSGQALSHHNVFFSDDYRGEFDDLFRIGRLPQDPTLYLCAQDRDAGDRAVQRPERFQIIMNAPADGDLVTPSEQEIETCETRVFNRLREAGVNLAPPQAENALTTPWDFANLFPGTGGAIYGDLPHSLMSTFRRPTARTRIPGLYLAGGGVHPGPGVPMAALSGRHAAAAILEDRALTSGSRLTGMPGGMSTASPTTAGAVSRLSDS